MNNCMRKTNVLIGDLYITPDGKMHYETPLKNFEKCNVLISSLDNKSYVTYNIDTITLSQCMTLYSLFSNTDKETSMYFLNLK